MSFPVEKLSSLRQLIHSKIHDLGVQDKIKECIDDGDSERGGGNEERLLSQLRDKGVIDDILTSLKLSSEVNDKTNIIESIDECTCEQERVVGGERFIRVNCLISSLYDSEKEQAVLILKSNGRKGISGTSSRNRDDTRMYSHNVYITYTL